jgi:hypothetical protein
MVEDIKFWVAHHQLTYRSPTRDHDGTCKFCNSPAAGRRLFCERCLPERSTVGHAEYAQIYNLLYRACGFADGASPPSCRLSRPKPAPVPKTVVPCAHCGADFDKWHPRQRFCSKRCNRVDETRRARARNNPDHRRHGVCMHCSGTCRVFVCDVCREQKKRERALAIKEHRRVNGRKKYKKPIKRGVCRRCEVKCENYVCNDCQRDVVEQGRRKYRERLQGIKSEPYTSREIAERDGWRCQLCRKPVNPRKRHPDPMCASIDHIVPISQGGTDVRANVQLAHLFCNMSKGNRAVPDGEQLRLLG